MLLQIGKLECLPELYIHLQIFKANMPATVTRDSHYYTYLAHLEQNDTNRNDPNALKNVNNCLNTNIYSDLETSGGQISNLYLNVAHFFNTSVNQTSVAT